MTTPTVELQLGDARTRLDFVNNRVYVGRDPQCGLVSGEASLSRRHAAFGIQDHHLEARAPMECGSDCCARIAGRGDDDRRVRCVAGPQPRQRAGEEARCVILERCGRPVEEFESMVAAAGERAKRRIERVGVSAQFRQRIAQR